jgi:hypothetical protein
MGFELLKQFEQIRPKIPINVSEMLFIPLLSNLIIKP